MRITGSTNVTDVSKSIRYSRGHSANVNEIGSASGGGGSIRRDTIGDITYGNGDNGDNKNSNTVYFLNS